MRNEEDVRRKEQSSDEAIKDQFWHNHNLSKESSLLRQIKDLIFLFANDFFYVLVSLCLH